MVGSEDWDFVGSVYFATTVVTTIGYGVVTPRTVAGRIFCIIYAILGIPLVFYVFAFVGRQIMETMGLGLESVIESYRPRKLNEPRNVALPTAVAVLITFLIISLSAIGFYVS